MRRLCFLAVLTLAVLSLHAQMNYSQYQYADETQLWRLTRNAAGLSLDPQVCDSSANRGVASLNVFHREGDYRRVQEGGMNNQLEFFTERYQKVGRYFYGYGSFRFDMGRTKDRAWSDVLRSYNSNPFISGSSVAGKYDSQDIELKADLSTVRLGRFTFGAGLLYKVGDLSRIRDPRSRINLAEYRIAPAATYFVGSHTVGLTAHYDRRKEKLPNLSTVQTDPNLKYYVMTGMENAEGAIGGYKGYMREYVNHEFGFEMSYGFTHGLFKSVNALTLDVGREYVYGTNKYQPGRYKTLQYGFSSRNRLQRGGVIHSADLSVAYEMGAADEYKQERTITKDSITGEPSTVWNTLITYRKRYQLKKFDLGVHYRQSFVDREAVAGYVGLSYDCWSVSNKHVLATSQLKYTSSLFFLEGGYGLLGKRLWVSMEASYLVNHDTELQLYDASTDYAVGVLIPDMDYYRADYWQCTLSVQYLFPLTLGGRPSRWFAKAYGSYLKADNSMSGRNVGFSVGLYY